MIRRLLAAALAVGLTWGAGPGTAQVATNAAGLREIAARLLAAGEAERARDLALALLSRDGRDVAALLLLGRAELGLGNALAALVAARRAHAEAGNGRARFTAARIAARANADLGRWTRAQVWLRRARRDAPDMEAVAAVAQDYRAATARNPLAVRLNFGTAPSSNVNGGSSEDEPYSLPGFDIPFANVGDALALSGLRFSVGGTLSYRIRQNRGSATFLETTAQGRTYLLSDEAKRIAPDAEGSDYADVVVSETLIHRWRGDGDSGPSSVRLSFGRSWYGGEPYTRFARASYDRSFVVTLADTLGLLLAVDRTERQREVDLDPLDADPEVGSVDVFEEYGSAEARGSWTHRLPSGDRSSVSVGLDKGLGELVDVTYRSVAIGVGYDWGRPIRGVRVSVSTELDWRDYDATGPFEIEDARRDLRGSARVSLGLPRLDVWGFYPSITLEASRTESDVGRYDRNALSFDLGVRSSF